MLNVHRGSHAVILFLENVVTSRKAFDLREDLKGVVMMEFSDSRLYNRYHEYLDLVRWFVFRAYSNDEFLKDIKLKNHLRRWKDWY